MKTDLADGQTLKEMIVSGTAWLGKSALDINAINVFPVPDGDTGTNMALTMQFALQEVKSNPDNQASSVAKSMAHGALMGARGNSGVILSQCFRGLAKGLDGKASFDGGDFAKALAEASRAAYKGIANPVEGTILTVLKDASKAAQEAGKNDAALVSVLEAAVKAAEDSVARTPSLLPALRDAGVVDAGGQGLYVLLDGALQFLKGESHKIQYRRPRLVVAEKELVPRAAQRPTQLETPHGYCTNLVLEGQSLDSDKIEKDLKKKGQFIAILNDEDLIARADEAGDAILEALGKAGADKADIITVYYGAEIKSAEAREIAQEIRDGYKAEVEVVHGGQPHHNYVISLE
jgi:DAK2 domain fusion protein YloV